MIFRLECIRDETINNLTKKRVVCPSVVRNVGKMIMFAPNGSLSFRGMSITKAMSFFTANEDDVASLLNLKDMCQKEV